MLAIIVISIPMVFHPLVLAAFGFLVFFVGARVLVRVWDLIGL